jgi:RHS repeat-associated protein
MKTNHIILAAILAASTALQTAVAENKLPAPKPEFKTQEQLVKWSEEKTKEAAAADSVSAIRDSQFFFTGKPYLEEPGTYAFRFRSYDPELSRWTSADPSGFPDGANQNKYFPNPLSAIDFQGLLTINLNTGVSTVIVNGEMQISGILRTATTAKGNVIDVFKPIEVFNYSGDSPYDISANCHGYIFLSGYWINNDAVPTILADEWIPTTAEHARIVVYGGNQHTARVLSRDEDGGIESVMGKNGYLPVEITSLFGTGYSGPAYYE